MKNNYNSGIHLPKRRCWCLVFSVGKIFLPSPWHSDNGKWLVYKCQAQLLTFWPHLGRLKEIFIGFCLSFWFKKVLIIPQFQILNSDKFQIHSVSCEKYLLMYSWPLTNTGVRGTHPIPQVVKNPHTTFDCPQLNY